MASMGVLHDGAPFAFGTWACECARCARRLVDAGPTAVVLKCEGGRAVVPARVVGELGADALADALELGAVREVFVAADDRAMLPAVAQLVAGLEVAGADVPAWLYELAPAHDEWPPNRCTACGALGHRWDVHDFGGATDGVGGVFSDADPGL